VAPSADASYERVSLPERDADILRDLISSENAQTVIEIGLAYGSSALAISEALVSAGPEGGKHLILDPYQNRFQNAGWNAIVAAGLNTFSTLLTERSQVALPRLVEEGLVADAAFVDGSHIFHNVFVDLYYLRELLRPGGLIVLDDCEWPSVGTAVNYFVINAGWSSESIIDSTRLRAFRLPNPVVEPSFEDFRPFQI
jgi:predicted O-methyltransferase YrrM